MQVTAEQTFLSPSARRRGRICRREDGRYQIVTETLVDGDPELAPYWLNDHPPSGLFADATEARAHLLAILPDAAKLHGVEPCTFQLDVGPYPEPVRTSA